MYNNICRRIHVHRSRWLSSSSSSSAAFVNKPYRVLGVQQIAIGGVDKQRLSNLWSNVLGMKYVKTFVSESENVDEDVLMCGHGASAVEVDIMQPLNPDASPKVHKPPLNHVGLWVDNIDVAVDYMKSNGVRFAGGIRDGASGRVAFIHPKGNESNPLCGEGVLIELVQAPRAVIEFFEEQEERANRQ